MNKSSANACRHLAALVGYVLLALLFTFPLALKFRSHCLGQHGDAPIWLWHLWHFRYSVTELHSNPLWTDLVLWPYGGNLLMQNGLFYDAVGYFLQPFLGLIGTYNLCMLQTLILSGYGVFLAASGWGAGWAASFVSGIVFAFSPEMLRMIIGGGGFDHTSRQGLPFFVWALSRAIRTGRFWDASLAGLILTWIWGCSYHFFLISVLLLPLFFVFLRRPLRFEWRRRPSGSWTSALRRILEGCLLLDLAWLLYSLRGGQLEFHGRGSARELVLYVAPYLLLWGFLLARLYSEISWSVRFDREAFRKEALFPYAAVLGSYAALNFPMNLAVLSLMRSGGYGGPQNAWRGGGNPTDLLSLIKPSALHPLWGRWIGPADSWAVDTAYLGLIPLIAAAWLWRRKPKDPWVRLWFAGAAFGFLLTLGPWLKIGSFHTYLPLPFYGLHLLPIYSNIQNGHRLSVFVSLFLALLFAAALKETASVGPRVSRWAPLAAFGLLIFEFAHSGMPLSKFAVPALFHRMAALPAGPVLPIPVGSCFDGIDAAGFLGESAMLPHYQVAHHMPIVGGGETVGRIPRYVFEGMRDDALLKPLVSAQSGGPISPALRDPAFTERYFRQMHLRYVLVFMDRIPAALARAIARWPLRLVDEDRDAALKLYEFAPAFRVSRPSARE